MSIYPFFFCFTHIHFFLAYKIHTLQKRVFIRFE
ncbi:unnamed protein product [Arabidopsis halleri]